MQRPGEQAFHAFCRASGSRFATTLVVSCRAPLTTAASDRVALSTDLLCAGRGHYLCAGASDVLRTQLHLGDAVKAAEHFAYLQPPSPSLAVNFASTFEETHEALCVLVRADHSCKDDATAVAEDHWRTCAAILYIGQLRFDAAETQSADPASVVSSDCKEAVQCQGDSNHAYRYRTCCHLRTSATRANNVPTAN